jgi:dolichol kinase
MEKISKDTKLSIGCILIAYTIGGICYALNTDIITYEFSKIINTYFIIVGYNVCFWMIIIYLRWKYLENHGMTLEEYFNILGNRKDFHLELYQLRYPNKVLNIADGLFRKINHILTTIFNIIIITYYIEDDHERLQLSIIGQFSLTSVSLLCYHTNTFLSFLVYGSSCRIRDGKSARLNILTVRMIGIPSFVIIGSLLSVYKDTLTQDEKKISLLLMYLPLIIGDAMGEIIGSIFGKHTFKVYGIGEINRKSYEGTFAVFISSFISILSVCFYNNVNHHTYLLGFIISIVSTIVELSAVRSTDNFMIPIVNALILILWTSNIDSHLIG